MCAARFHVEGLGDERVAPEIEATLYRIAQEALNNVARHAHAQSVGVVLERRGRTLSLVIEDDGVGFDASTISNTMIGLVGMRERAAVVGGSLDIEPTAGGGTTVLARVPLYLTDHNPLVDDAASADSSVALGDAPFGDLPAADVSGRTAQLQRAVAARDEFIATVAHELRNPIAPLMFQIRLSIDKAEQMDRAGEAIPAEWARGQLRRIEQRLHRLLETLDRLLDVSRLSSGRIDLEFETVDLAEVVRDVVGSFEAELAVARCEARVTTPAAVDRLVGSSSAGPDLSKPGVQRHPVRRRPSDSCDRGGRRRRRDADRARLRRRHPTTQARRHLRALRTRSGKQPEWRIWHRPLGRAQRVRRHGRFGQCGERRRCRFDICRLAPSTSRQGSAA